MAQMLTLRDKNFQVIKNMLKKLKEKKDKMMSNINIEIESLKFIDIHDVKNPTKSELKHSLDGLSRLDTWKK